MQGCKSHHVRSGLFYKRIFCDGTIVARASQVYSGFESLKERPDKYCVTIIQRTSISPSKMEELGGTESRAMTKEQKV